MCNAIYLNPTIETLDLFTVLKDEFSTFSKEYYEYLAGDIISYIQYFHNDKGSPINYGTRLPHNPSYKGISKENQKHDSTDYDLIHKIEIRDFSVYLNDVLIVSAPGKKNKTFKERFCKSVVWSLMNDDQCLQDKLAEINKPAVPAMPEKPSVPVGYIAYLGLSITEEVYV